MVQAPVSKTTFVTDSDKQQLIDSLNIPQEFKTVPGNPTRLSDERYHAYAYPEQPFFRTTNYEMYDAFMAREVRDITKPKNHSQVATDMHGAELEELRKTVWTYHRRPASKQRDPSPDLAPAMKAKAKELGFAVVGITRFDRKYVYKDFRRRAKFNNLVVVGIEQPWGPVQTSPSVEAYLSNFDATIPSYSLAVKLADWIRSLGYRVQFVVASQGGIQLSLAPVLPYAVAAGLGQLGANGQLLTPLFGSRIRLCAFSTDAPLSYDHPVDYGINKLCEKCQVCVRRCPGRALPKVKVWWRGALKYKTIADRCLPMLGKYDGCSICIKVCPVQRFGLKAVLDHYGATGKVLGKGTDELESYALPDKGYFGVGSMPSFSAEEGGKGMLTMGSKLRLRPIRRKRLGHMPGIGSEAEAGMERVDV
jgi:ferredoxin